MTRINCVPVECLTDKHLLAEYKEITRPFNKVIKRLENGTMDQVVIPDKYCLGKGHETFFFNKLRYILERYQSLCYELRDRGFNINNEQYQEIRKVFWGFPFAYPEYKHLFSEWEPTPEDMYLNMARLSKRSNISTVLAELQSEK